MIVNLHNQCVYVHVFSLKFADLFVFYVAAEKHKDYITQNTRNCGIILHTVACLLGMDTADWLMEKILVNLLVKLDT